MFKKAFLLLSIIFGLSNIIFAADDTGVSLPPAWSGGFEDNLVVGAGIDDVAIFRDAENRPVFLRRSINTTDLGSERRIELYHISNPSECIISRKSDLGPLFEWSYKAKDYLVEHDAINNIFLYKIIYGDDGEIKEIISVNRKNESFKKESFDNRWASAEDYNKFNREAALESHFVDDTLRNIDDTNLDGYAIIHENFFIYYYKEVGTEEFRYLQVYDFTGYCVCEYDNLTIEYYIDEELVDYNNAPSAKGFSFFNACCVVDAASDIVVLYKHGDGVGKAILEKSKLIDRTRSVSVADDSELRLIILRNIKDVEVSDDVICIKYESRVDGQLHTKCICDFNRQLRLGRSEYSSVVCKKPGNLCNVLRKMRLGTRKRSKRSSTAENAGITNLRYRVSIPTVSIERFGELGQCHEEASNIIGSTGDTVSYIHFMYSGFGMGEPSGSGGGSGEEPQQVSYISGAGGPGAGGSLSNHDDDDNDRRGVRDMRPRKKSRHSE